MESATSQMRSVKQSETPSATTNQNHEPSPTKVQNANPTEQLIRRKFQEYYLSLNKEFYIPPHPEEREYGFLLFKEKFMVRHRAFRDPSVLSGAIRDLVPAHVYFSTAYYQEPTAAMEEKGWKGADLVFDIDADHLDTPCKPSHDSWKCKGCGTMGKGGAPKICPECKNDRMEERTWLCEQCLQQAKEETNKLLEILYSDLGVEPSNLRVFFSGHRGYHVHVYSTQLQVLGEEERREIASYVLGQALDPQLHELDEVNVGGVKVIEGPQLGQPGWRGRIATVVTTDVHRLIRLPGTLNGHTGLLTMQVPRERLDEFDPFRDSLAFQGEMRIRVIDSPRFQLAERQFGPYLNEEVELPSYAAMLLLCKRRAGPVG